MKVLRITPLWDWRSIDPPLPLARPAESVGGHAAQALRMTLATADLGVEQTVLASHAVGGPARAQLRPGVEVRGLGPAGVAGVHRRNLAWLSGVLGALPGLRRDRWDVVHVHASGIVEPLLAALAARATLPCPLVLTLHHSAQVTYVARSRRDAAVQVATRAAERAAVGRADRTLTLTDRVARRLASQGRLERLPDCVDAAAFAAGASPRAGAEFARRLGLPQDAPVALYVGRISAEKGWRDLLGLAEAITELHVVICGDGPDLETLRSRAGARVHVTGAVPTAEVAAAMAAADVLVLPSSFEELGSVLIEAMAAGLFSVAYDVGGISEAIEVGTTGLLAPPGDLRALTATVARVVADDGLRQRARLEGPRIARARFDLPAIGARLRDLYSELSATSRRRR
jgi:glycogen(starch) synthase